MVSSLRKTIVTRLQVILIRLLFGNYPNFGAPNWEFVSENWIERAGVAAEKIISTGVCEVMDFGAGNGRLVEMLRSRGWDGHYVPVDLVSRNSNYVALDFNKPDLLPNIKIESIAIIGSLEYCTEVPKFVNWLSQSTTFVILCYNSRKSKNGFKSYYSLLHRKFLLWRSQLRQLEIIELFSQNDFNLVLLESDKNGDWFIFYNNELPKFSGNTSDRI